MILKLITLVIFIAWILYWQIEQHKAYTEKPLSSKNPKVFNVLGRIGIRVVFIVVVIQLLGISFIPIRQAIVFYQYTGFLLVLIGMGISISARNVLSSNWSNGYEYQIKKGQELVTGGVYKFIRHPIYSGMTFMFIGAEMVAGSWLFISFLGLWFGAYMQGRREEKILLAHFGEKYKEYMQKSKMLIPFIF